MGKFYIAYRMKRQGLYYHVIQVQKNLQAELETPQHLTYVNRYNECLELLRECFPEADLQPLHIQPGEAPEAVQELAHRMLSAALQTPEDCVTFRGICAKARGKRSVGPSSPPTPNAAQAPSPPAAAVARTTTSHSPSAAAPTPTPQVPSASPTAPPPPKTSALTAARRRSARLCNEETKAEGKADHEALRRSPRGNQQAAVGAAAAAAAAGAAAAAAAAAKAIASAAGAGAAATCAKDVAATAMANTAGAPKRHHGAAGTSTGVTHAAPDATAHAATADDQLQQQPQQPGNAPRLARKLRNVDNGQAQVRTAADVAADASDKHDGAGCSIRDHWAAVAAAADAAAAGSQRKQQRQQQPDVAEEAPPSGRLRSTPDDRSKETEEEEEEEEEQHQHQHHHSAAAAAAIVAVGAAAAAAGRGVRRSTGCVAGSSKSATQKENDPHRLNGSVSPLKRGRKRRANDEDTVHGDTGAGHAPNNHHNVNRGIPDPGSMSDPNLLLERLAKLRAQRASIRSRQEELAVQMTRLTEEVERILEQLTATATTATAAATAATVAGR